MKPGAFFKWSSQEKRLFLKAFWLLIRVRILFIVLPFARLQARYSRHPEATAHNPELATQIRDALRRAGKLSMWRNTCLVHTFAARKMLNSYRLDSQAFLGVQRHNQHIDFAHAWIKSSGIEVVPAVEGYVPAHEF